MKRTEPSPKNALTPPGCRLREPAKSPPSTAMVDARQLLDGLTVAKSRQEEVRLGAGRSNARRRPGLKQRDIILVAVRGKPRHVTTPAGQRDPERSADVVRVPLQDLRRRRRVLLNPSVTDATLTRLGPVAAALMPNGTRQMEGGVGLEERGRVGIRLAEIGVPPVDAVVSLGRPQFSTGRPRAARVDVAEDLHVIARALERGDPGRRRRYCWP